MPSTATVTAPGAEDVVIIQDVSWETYCRLNDENSSPAVRMNFFEGALEIMTLSLTHENRERTIDMLVQTLAGILRLDMMSFGSVTMRRRDVRAGLEPDACFYFGPMAALMRGRRKLDLLTDPAPDLAVGIDISRRSTSKFPLYAALGIREIWVFDDAELLIHELANGEYRATEASTCLARVTGKRLTHLLDQHRALPFPEWLDLVHASATR